MKKLLGIMALCLLWSTFSAAEVEKVLKEIKKNKDIAQGFNKVYEYEKKNKWRVTNKEILKSDKSLREHVVKIVDKSDNHPVRFGKQSLRFEVRNGDGWGWDSRNDRERVELLICCVNKKTTWTAWSLYLPNDYEKIFPAKTMLAQFHNDADNPPAFAFENQSDRRTNEGGGYWIEVDEYVGGNNVPKKLLDHSEMLGRWNDILVNAKWTHKDDGFFKIWVNNKLAYDYKGQTKSKGVRTYYKFGIYRSWISKYKSYHKGKEVPTQVVYFDEVRAGKTKEKVIGNLR